MKWLRIGLPVLFAVLLIYLLFWPVSVDPVAWSPPENPGFEGKYAANTKLSAAEELPVPGSGPEDITIDDRGNLITGIEDGRILRLSLEGEILGTIANTGGRPLGLDRGPQGNIYVADARRGLLKVTPSGTVSELLTSVNGKPLGFTNHLTVSQEGIVYFTDSSRAFNYDQVKLAVIDHRADGRLIEYNPTTNASSVLLGGLVFPNGVALAADEESLYLNEMGNYRVLTVRLTGDETGDTSVFIDNLPGFPDNLSRDGNKRLWVGLPTPRNGLLDAAGPYPFLRKMMVRLPSFLQPAPARHGMVLGFSPEGELVANLQDATGTVAFTASAVHHDGRLFVGSYREPGLWRYDLTRRNE